MKWVRIKQSKVAHATVKNSEKEEWPFIDEQR